MKKKTVKKKQDTVRSLKKELTILKKELASLRESAFIRDNECAYKSKMISDQDARTVSLRKHNISNIAHYKGSVVYATKYKNLLAEAHALIGRLVHQISDRGNTVALRDDFESDFNGESRKAKIDLEKIDKDYDLKLKSLDSESPREWFSLEAGSVNMIDKEGNPCK